MENHTTTTDRKDHVEDYISKGWVGNFPLPSNAKFSPPENTTGRIAELTDDETRAKWDREMGDRNIGVRIPKGYIGIDIDHYGSKKGWYNFSEFLELEGVELDLVEWNYAYPRSTRRGVDSPAAHFFFKLPEGYENMEFNGKACDDVELLQHHHRYSVVWPSEVDGEQYKWYLGDDEIGVPNVKDLPALPLELAEALVKATPREGVVKGNPESLKASLEWLESRVFAGEGVREFPCDIGRYDTMRDTVLSLVSNAVHRGHSGLLADLSVIRSRREAYELAEDRQISQDFSGVLTSAVSIVKKEISEGLEEDINWQERFGPETFLADLALPNFSELLVKKIEAYPKEMADEDGLAWGPSDTDAILSGGAVRREPELLQMTDGSHLLYRGKVHNVYAPSETGKSWVMFAAAASVLQHGGYILHVDAEMDVFDCVENLRLLGVPDQYLTREHYWHIADMDNPAIDNHSRDRWEYLLEAKPWDLVLMDSVGQLMGGMDNNSSAEYREWHRLMPNKARLKGLTVVMIDHISKTQELAGNIGHPEGTTNKKNQADVTIYLRKVGDGLEIGKVGELEILITKDRFGSLRKAGVNGYKGFKCRGRFRLDSTDRGRSVWSFIPSQGIYAEGVKPGAPIASTGVLDEFNGSIGEINIALVTFLDTEGTGVTRTELTQAWKTYAPTALVRHSLTKVERSESGLKNENRRLFVNPSPRLLAESSQATIKAMISALAEAA